MTHKEHQLIVGILAKQLQLIKALTEALKSADILKRGDFAAFVALATSGVGTSDDLINQAEKMYLDLAIPIGVEVPTKIF